jgi:hypothetical protein
VRKQRTRWRVGKKLGRTLYRDDSLVGLVDTADDAAEIVQAMNGEDSQEAVRLRRELEDQVEAFDGIIEALKDKHHEGAWSVACCAKNSLVRFLTGKGPV